MLPSAGVQITAHPEEEVFICRAVSNDERASLVHGFPLDWNHWQIHEWPDQLAEIRAVTSLPLWYSLYDLPRAWPATTRHREAEGSSYYRHFYMGLLREDGSPKLALRRFHGLTPGLRDLPMVSFRGSPAGSRGAVAQGCAEQWFDRQFALESFDVTVTFCFTPECQSLKPHHTSPPRQPEAFADFCAAQVRKYC